ncbi:MAG: UvrD-helicase domain-containing protein [Halieaceae bacterium]|nr:UvrD-helicase domain-containing protein [Halieaceae bacterium]
MSNAESLIPEITDDDIEWVRLLMGLDRFDKPRRDFLKRRTTVDLSACPGSGKTTLIVAKLAILAKKWPHRTKGICVLSHTNVAREQIEQRLGRTVVGQRLLAYPHFIDTIHGFMNRFLALPWLYSNNYPSPTIDDDVTTAYRRGVLGQKYWVVQNFLDKKRSGFDRLRILNRDLSFGLGGKPFPANTSTLSFQHAKRAIETAAQAGYFCYDEMFVWANALLEDQKHLPTWLAHRFPLVILDEMQDTFERQKLFLNTVFARNSDRVVVQRVGDPNQEIFDLPDSNSSTVEPYPDPDPACCLGIPNSYRFGREIAELASPFAVRPVGNGGLSGIGPMGPGVAAQDSKHAIFVFPDDSTDGVLEAFGKHALDVLGEVLIPKGTINAVGHIHQENSEVSPGHTHYPKSVGDYWDGYAFEISRKDPNPRTLAQYIRAAQGLVAHGRALSPGVEKIAYGILELARRLGDIGDLKRKARTHRAVVGALEGATASLTAYRGCLRRFLVEGTALSKDGWLSHAEDLTAVAADLCRGETDPSRAEQFLAWPNDDPSLGAVDSSSSGDAGPNIFRANSSSGTIDIRLGSIHSVKGQTHLATLLLSTYWHAHSAKEMMPWLLGEKINGKGAGKRNIQRLLHTYVAMTRPSHLICLAVQRSALGCELALDQNIATLKGRGWQVAEIVDGGEQWRN